MVELNATLPLLGPISSTVQQVLGVFSLFVGGIFGIYVITLVVRVAFFRKIYKSFEEIREEIKLLDSKVNILLKRKK
jgi:membrane-bound metal-dependent hydrolase YbcI (DUF457 family)